MLGEFEAHEHWPFFRAFFDQEIFVVDEFSAFLLPLAALIFLVTVMSTLRTKAPRFSLELTLASEAIMLATFSCRASWTLVVLLAVAVIFPYLELRKRGRCTRIYTVHMSVFVGLLLAGYAWLTMTDLNSTAVLIPGCALDGCCVASQRDRSVSSLDGRPLRKGNVWYRHTCSRHRWSVLTPSCVWSYRSRLPGQCRASPSFLW